LVDFNDLELLLEIGRALSSLTSFADIKLKSARTCKTRKENTQKLRLRTEDTDLSGWRGLSMYMALIDRRLTQPAFSVPNRDTMLTRQQRLPEMEMIPYNLQYRKVENRVILCLE
jgi:hypothetical protein